MYSSPLRDGRAEDRLLAASRASNPRNTREKLHNCLPYVYTWYYS